MTLKHGLITVFVTGLLLSSVATVALARDDQDQGPAGTWNGVIEQNGTQKPLALQFTEVDGLWRGRLEVDGATSAMERLSVDGNHVRFALPGQGVFDGVLSSDKLSGSVSGSASPGSFTAKREESESEFGDPIESEGP
jgi:hypothetical protein